MTGFDDDWRAWRAAREERMRDPHGWLAITAIHWLTPEPERFDGVPGSWSYDEHGAAVVLGPDERLTLDGVDLAEGRHVLGQVDGYGVRLSYGDTVVEVAARDGAILLRPRRPDSPQLLAYQGTPTFPPNPDWVIGARFEPYPSGIATSTEDEVATGEVVFEYDGSEHRLVAWGEDDGSLWILLRDATSGITTYAASRQLLLEPPGPDGRVDIDFNRTTNLPCAYTAFATCPVPPAANTLRFAVEAGEQVPTMEGPAA